MKSRAAFKKDGLLYFDDERVALFVNTNCGAQMLPNGDYNAIGVLNANDELVGGLIFFNGQDNDITLAMALTSPLATLKHKVAAVLSYPFIQLKKPRISAEIAMSNTRCIRLAKAMGFKQEGLKRGAANDGGDLGIFGLLHSEFKLKDL